MAEEFEFKCDPWKSDERQIKALDASIKHWEDNAFGKIRETYSMSCACCVEFRFKIDSRIETCEECPIAISTGKFFCAGISYELATEAKNKEDFLKFSQYIVNELKMIRAKALP